MKKILICIDGTGNEPEDANPKINDDGGLEDENISNVLKLHLRAGGRLSEPVESFGQISLYFPGPGTRGGLLHKAVESALAPRSLDKILREVLSQLRGIYHPGDEISVFGFSRGAAIARRFVSHLQTFGLADDTKGSEPGHMIPVRFIGVWDTVLSEGTPQKNKELRDPAELGEQNNIRPGVGRIYHLVSIDDPRLVFTPTLFDPDERVTEVWFSGVHSDVGGGYRNSGLSDITLEFMIERAHEEAGLTFVAPNEVALGPATGGLVDPSDIQSLPDSAAKDHKDNFDKLFKEFVDALAPRNVMSRGDAVPVLHPSVVERGKSERYRPENLINVRHRIWGRPNIEYEDFQSHFRSA